MDPNKLWLVTKSSRQEPTRDCCSNTEARRGVLRVRTQKATEGSECFITLLMPRTPRLDL